MYGLIGQIVAVDGKRDELVVVLVGMGSMPGCLSYVVARDPDKPDTLWVTEVWESSQAHADSLQLAEVQEAIGKGRPLIAGFESRVETEPIGGIGLG
ncbi:MAG: antibiotic biosynthesis monooxygenase [bacterium]|nr:antibiotic biosynthesis monooxygenase [bacterium]